MLEIDTIYTVHISLVPNGLQTKFTYVVYLNFPHFQEKFVTIFSVEANIYQSHIGKLEIIILFQNWMIYSPSDTLQKKL